MRPVRVFPALAVPFALAGAATAQDCPFSSAIYNQPGSAWELRFSPVSHDAASNQVNAFTIAIPLADLDRTITGAIYVPNGASPNYGSMVVPCGPDGVDECKPWEGTAYALVGDGIVPLPHEDEPAPRQILFPAFSSGIWYSPYRAALLGAENENVGDVFTFSGCRG